MTLYIDTKPTLEWVDSPDGYKAWADIYELQKLADGRFLLLIAEHCQDTYYKSMDEAKAAAQADYERRTAERFRPITLPERMNARQGDGSVHYCAGWNDVLDAIAKARGEA